MIRFFSRLALVVVAGAAVLSAQQQQQQQPRRAPAAKKSAKSAPAAPAAATGPAAASTRYPIEKVRVTGSKLYAEAAILPVAGLAVGELLEERKIEAARDNLLVHGAFSNVSYRYEPAPSGKGYVVTFEVIDFEQLFPFRVERLDVDEAKLRAALKSREPLFGDRIPGADNSLARYSKAIAEILKAENKPSEVRGRVVSESGETYVLFSPPGLLPAVATVTFTGNKVLSLTMLQNTIHPVAVGLPFRENRFREILETGIRPLYESRGRLRMKFGAIKAEPSPGIKGLGVTVAIEEGESYSFGEVSVTGVPGAESELEKAAAIPYEAVADAQVIAAAQERIHRAMRRIGHMSVSTTVVRKLNDADKLCHLVFNVVPGPKFNFGRLFLTGLDLHGEHEIKRIWTMKTGAPFNGEYPEFFLNKIREDQLFDGLVNARAIPIVNEAALTVDVRLVFNEKRAKPAQ